MTVCAVFPYNPCLLRPRSLHVIKAMLAAGHTVRVVYVAERFGQDFAQSDVAGLCCDVRKVRFAGVVPTLLRWLRGMSVSLAWCGSHEAKLGVRSLSEGADVVWVEHLRGAGMLPDGLDVPVVWDAVDALGPLFEGRADLVRNPLKAWMFHFEAVRTHQEETRLTSRFCKTVAVTDREAEQIGSSVISIPNGVDCSYFQPAELPQPIGEYLHICMVGRWNYLPNAHGCCAFLRDVWPEVHRAFPMAICTIIGPGCETGSLVADAAAAGRNEGHIVLAGPVEDIRPYLQTCVLSVCPALLAAGMQNKILESIACGAPVVCTDKAALGTVPGGMNGLFSVSTPAEMAETICNLLSDPMAAKRQGMTGRREMEQTMTWEPSYRKIAALLEQVLHS